MKYVDRLSLEQMCIRPDLLSKSYLQFLTDGGRPQWGPAGTSFNEGCRDEKVYAWIKGDPQICVIGFQVAKNQGPKIKGREVSANFFNAKSMVDAVWSSVKWGLVPNHWRGWAIEIDHLQTQQPPKTKSCSYVALKALASISD